MFGLNWLRDRLVALLTGGIPQALPPEADFHAPQSVPPEMVILKSLLEARLGQNGGTAPQADTAPTWGQMYRLEFEAVSKLTNKTLSDAVVEVYERYERIADPTRLAQFRATHPLFKRLIDESATAESPTTPGDNPAAAARADAVPDQNASARLPDGFPAGANRPALPLPVCDEDLKAMAEGLLWRIYSIYGGNNAREKALSRFVETIKLAMWQWVNNMMLLFIVSVLLYLTPDILRYLNHGSEYYEINQRLWGSGSKVFNLTMTFLYLFFIAMIGILGGLFSILQRSQDTKRIPVSVSRDSVSFALRLNSGDYATAIAKWSGALFAVVLILVTTSGIISSELLDIKLQSMPSMAKLLEHGLTMVDAKLFIAAFVAGFGERLVPDVLDRLVRTPNAPENTAPPAT